MKQKEPSVMEMKKIRERVAETSRIEKLQNQSKFKWHSTAVTIIKEKLAERKARNLPNDWKIQFYEAKLQQKKSIMGKLSRLLK